MRSALLAAGLALASGICAQEEPYYRNQSAPFNLVLSSRNKTLDGSKLYACHEGAAIEGLCVAKTAPASSGVFTLVPLSPVTHLERNYTDINGPPQDSETGYTGLITWLLVGGNFVTSSSLQLQPSATSNVAVPLFFPGPEGYANFGFDKDDRLFVPSYIDDTVTPPVYRKERLYRWYACLTNAGYVYETLAWVVGTCKPQNPTCEKVTVKRVFI
ncbi:hypothetical protein MBM_09206 [Drepanopeziza brunnea f. sp. 'multigermtubi' MB_m1]|uniref:DUF7907 domain-containing protein n=1 Tax=Marssonina brunnea f. sp. multigermtubi (strain MB_m1) TaxID=1072389 RepID=K1WKB9_MARBU|nr:uncharacterized protein MBM_09206 [Drepanopeziza brunnea f. sp. 'multigermtubi' MB_m1]EKD12637.1 hypothetical protein MBM_09206 [Drepanopeziza brunnea f. sp. 'multigermtubi' MB_m1]